MRVSKERLSVIGRLIGIYREERRDNTQNEYTQKRFCDGICSPNTLKSIEAGGLSRSEDIYIELLDKLGLKYGEFPAIDEAIDEIVEEIYVAIEYYDRSRIEVLTDKATRILSKVKDYVYYSELNDIFKVTHQYYMNDIIMDDDEMNHFELLLGIENFYLSDILKVLIYSKIYPISVSDTSMYYKKINTLKMFESNLNCMKINKLHYYLVAGKFRDMDKLICVLEGVYKNEDNMIRLIDVYNYAVGLSGYIDVEAIEVYISKIDEIINKQRIPDIKVCESYANIGSYYHNQKHYSVALLYYEKMLNHFDESFLPNLLYMADCQNRLNIKIDIPIVSNELLRRFPIELRMMYKYFTFGEDTPVFIKQNYIMKKIAPTLVNEVNIEIFKYEIGRLVDINGHYKNVHDFEKIVNKNLNRS